MRIDAAWLGVRQCEPYRLAVVRHLLRRRSAAGVRASRRQRAGAREHHGGVRQRACPRRRRSRARRASVARRRGRRAPRPDARPHDDVSRGPIADAHDADELRRAGRADARRGARALPRVRDHHRVEGEQRGAGRGRGRRRAPRRTPSIASASARSGWRVLRAARAIEPARRHERGARRGALGALPFVVPVAGVARRLRRIPGAGARRADARRVAALRRPTRTAPVSACRSGRSTRKRTPAACWRGASTR